jgi:hypothetical protein
LRTGGQKWCDADRTYKSRFLDERLRLADELTRRALAAYAVSRQHLLDSAELSISACEQLSRAHERLAKAGSGDVGEHHRQSAEYDAVVGVLRDALRLYREAIDPPWPHS